LEGEQGTSDVKFLIGRSAGRSAVIAGFVATHIATMAGLWFNGARLPQFDFNTLNGLLALGTTFGFANPYETFLVGGLMHYTSGIIWAVAFALILHPALGRAIPPLAALKSTNNYVKGLIFGVALWIISSALWMPLLIGPLLGPALTGPPPGGFGLDCGVGPFLTCFGGNDLQALFANLLWHTIYGLNLGLLYNPTPGRPSRGMWKPSSGVGVR
jgi:hypothetical protein